MFPHYILKKFQRQKNLIVPIIQIHILLLLFIGIVLFMGNLKKEGGTPFNLFFSSPETEKNFSEQPVERKARILLPPEKSRSSEP